MISLIAIILLPFCVFSRNLIHEGQQYAFITFCVLFIGWSFKDKYIRAFCVYIFTCQVVLFFMALNNIDYLKPAMVGMGQCMYLVFGLLVVKTVIESKIRTETFYDVICIAALLQFALGISQIFKYDPMFNLYSKMLSVEVATNLIGKAVGMLGNTNFLSGYLAISLPFFYRNERRYLTINSFKIPYNFTWFIIPIVVLILTMQTSTAVLTIVVGFSAFIMNIWLFAIGLLLSVGFLYFDGFGSFVVRVQMWQRAIETLSESIWSVLFGALPGSNWGGGVQAGQHRILEGKCPLHNEYVQGLFRYGIVGMSILTLFFINLYRERKIFFNDNRILFAAFISILTNCFGSYPIELAPSVLLVLTIIGLIIRGEYDFSRNNRRS